LDWNYGNGASRTEMGEMAHPGFSGPKRRSC